MAISSVHVWGQPIAAARYRQAVRMTIAPLDIGRWPSLQREVREYLTGSVVT